MTWFIGGKIGSWRAVRADPVVGVPLARISRLEVTEREAQPPIGDWVLKGVTSFERYVTRAERSLLEARQGSLGRPSATRAALIPIQKSAAWWDLPQDE
ncbi:MAG TPA: chlorite dismutase, partial [Thermoplasmata archaeon]|nr:chlorite dismutase [Thermoplasmata archaeon]